MEAIAQAVAACADANGDIKVAAVVEAAMDEDSILHGEFEWDKDIAFAHSLEVRAAELIRQTKCMMIHEERELIFPCFVAAATPRTYSMTKIVAKDEARSTRVLEAELGRIKNAIRRALTLSIVFDLNAAFEGLLADAIAIEEALLHPPPKPPRGSGRRGRGKGGGAQPHV
jgi:hypothetical protein